MEPWSDGFAAGHPYYSYAQILCAQWGPRPYLCWVGGGCALGFHVIRLEDGRVGAVYPGCRFRPVPVTVARRESGLHWLPGAGPDAQTKRSLFEIERRRSPIVRVFERLADADHELVDPLAAERVLRSERHNDRRLAGEHLYRIVRNAVFVAARCDGLPVPHRGFVPGSAERADYCTTGSQTVASAWRASFALYTRATAPHRQTLSLDALLMASGWSKHLTDLDRLVADERLVARQERADAVVQLSLI